MNRRPLRVGRMRYGLWWLSQATAGTRSRARTVGDGAAAVGRELLWAAELSLRSTVAGIEYARPEPWGDRKLFGLVTAIAVGALAVAVVLGMGMAQWAMTSSNAMFFAAAGAVAVGLALLPLSYLVFASRRGRPRNTSEGQGREAERDRPHGHGEFGEASEGPAVRVVRPRVEGQFTEVPGEVTSARGSDAGVPR